jgi:hypothetical protein
MSNNYTKTMRQALEEARNYRDPTSEGGPGSGPQKDGASKPDDKSSPKARPKIDKVALQKDLEDKVTDGMIDIDHGKDGSMDMSKEYEGGQDYEVDRDVNAIKKDLMSKGISEKDIEIDIEEDEEYINLNVSVKGKPVSEGIDEGGPGSGPQKGGKKQSSANIKKAYGILNDPRYKQGNYSGAAKAIDKLSPGLSNHPDVKNAMKRANEELEEENRFSRQLKGRQREVYDLALKDIRKNKVYGEKDQDAVVDKVAGTSLMGNSLSDVKRAIQHESLDLSATGDTTTSNASQEDIVEKNINEVAPIAIAAVIARILSTTVAKNAGSAVKKALSTVPKVAKPAAVATTTTAGSPTTTLPESIENNKVDTTEGYDTGNTRPRDSRGSRLPLNKYPKPKSTIPVPSMNFVGSLTSQKNESKLSTSQLDTLKQKYSGLRGSEKNGIQMDKLAKIMKRYPESMLDQLAGLDIPMVSKVAKELLK